MTVGERLQQYRKNLGLSQEELGQRLLVSRQTVSQWETDQTMPTLDNLMRLKEVLGVSIDAILCNNDVSPEEAPLESYQFSFSDEEIKAFHQNRMFTFLWKPLLMLFLFLFVIVSAILNSDFSADVRYFLIVIWFILFVSFMIRFLTARKMQKQIDQEIASHTYAYNFYQDYFTMRINKQSSLSSFAIIPYNTIERIKNAAGFTFVYYNRNCTYTLLRTDDLQQDSVIFRFLKGTSKKGIYKRAPLWLNNLSWVTFILAIVSLPLWVLLCSLVVSNAEPSNYRAFPVIWTALVSLSFPIASIVLGCILKSKKLIYKKNLVIGIIMTSVIVLYGTILAISFGVIIPGTY